MKIFAWRERTGPTGRDVLLTGLPRSGTTLCCHLLDKLPGVLALHEPMDTGRLFATPGARPARDVVARFLARSRRLALADGVARTKHVGGEVPTNVVSDEVDERGERRRLTSKGTVTIGRPLGGDFTLVVKHNGLFAALLGELAAPFEVFGVVRNPLSVLSSWNSVPFGLRHGRSPGTERLAPALGAELDRIRDVTARQIHVLNWYFERYARLVDPARILRYEDVISTRGRTLRLVAPVAATLNEPLRSRNANPLYDRDTMRRLGERLLADDGVWREFYPPRDVEAVLASADAETSGTLG